MIIRNLNNKTLEYLRNQYIGAKDDLQYKVSDLSRSIVDIDVELRVRQVLEKRDK